MRALLARNRRAILAAFMAVVLAVGMALPVTLAYATPTAASKQAEAEAVLDQIDDMQEELDQASDAYNTALSEQEEAQAKVDEAQVKIDEANAKIEEGKELLSNRARSMYRNGGNSFLDVILGASSFEEFATNWSMLETLNENDAQVVAETKEARAQLESAQAEYEEQVQVAAEKAEEARAVKEEAEATMAEMQATYDSLSAEAQELLEQEEAARSAAAAAAAQAAINNSGSSSSADNSKVQTVTGNIVVDRAYAQLGKPYVWGACGPNSFDCSGLVSYCLTGNYSRFCTTSSMRSWTRVTNPQPGDLCLNSHHTGVYIGNGMMIHAPTFGDVVKISGVQSDMWYVRY